jgi:hypothetical protein
MDEHMPVGLGGSEAIPPRLEDWTRDPRAVQILTTEHWSLLSGRSLGWAESFSRASMFLTAVSGAVLALALVGQSTGYSRAFVTFALILLPVVLFMGLTTVTRLSQVNDLDLVYLQAMNRLRHAYLELVPGVAPYISTATHDDLPSSFFSAFAISRQANPVIQGLMTTPGAVAVVCSVLTGAIAGIVASQLTSGFELPIGAGAIGFLVCMVGLTVFRNRAFQAFSQSIEVRFPRTA